MRGQAFGEAGRRRSRPATVARARPARRPRRQRAAVAVAVLSPRPGRSIAGRYAVVVVEVGDHGARRSRTAACRRTPPRDGRPAAPATARAGTHRPPPAAARRALGPPRIGARIAAAAAAIAPSISRPGNGNSTLAQTPSRARRERRRAAADSRWVSQRSIPRVGTDTTSRRERVAGGSSEDRCQRVPRRASALCARWMCSTGLGRVAVFSRRPGGSQYRSSTAVRHGLTIMVG